MKPTFVSSATAKRACRAAAKTRQNARLRRVIRESSRASVIQRPYLHERSAPGKVNDVGIHRPGGVEPIRRECDETAVLRHAGLRLALIRCEARAVVAEAQHSGLVELERVSLAFERV